MEERYLEILEYPRILERLAEHTAFSGGRELALSLEVTNDLDEARRRQRETSEARELLEKKVGVSLGGVHDVRPLAARAARGSQLLPSELLDIQTTLAAASPLRRTLTRMGGQFPLLSDLAGRIDECAHVAAEIARCITPQAEVADSASPELALIRSRLVATRDRLVQSLERIVMAPENLPFLQDTLITQRGGRYVVPLKVECRGRIPGIVHDQSASGATLFVEPLTTVAINNEYKELELAEEREVNRILSGLSELVGSEAPIIERTVATLAQLDLIFARARYAEELEATEPTLVEFAPQEILDEARGIYHPGTRLRLMQARHPLLSPDTVVPVDIFLRLGKKGYFALVITGPNTGGKTVVLKTVGLLCLMAQAGMHVPAASGSILTVFDSIYADIGDEQSIEQSLSTFSSHVSNIIHILDQAGTRSLVLLDELGAGTDPVEGSALGRALLTELLQRGITTLATTHHPELKVFAQNMPGVENASVEFDVETLAPTYELSIGVPGRSNAFTIAERLGLSHGIVERARGLMAPEALEAESLLQEIRALRIQAQEELSALEEQERALAARESVLRGRLAGIEDERTRVIEEARREAREELAKLQEEIAAARRSLSLLRLRGAVTEDAESTIERAQSVAREGEQVLTPAQAPRPTAGWQPKIGAAVWVKTMHIQGTVTEVRGNQAEVSARGLKLWVATEDLEPRHPMSDEERVSRVASGSVALSATTSVKPELHLRGLRVDEAKPELERYLDSAYLAGLKQIRIIHGSGTGALRRFVREELSSHPLVESLRPGGPGEGGNGVTIAELAQR